MYLQYLLSEYLADLALLRVVGDVGYVVRETTIVLQKRRIGGHIGVAG